MSQVTVTKLVEGNSHVVIRVDMLSDGVTAYNGELLYYPIFSPLDCNPPHKANGPAFRIMQVWYGCVWFDVVLGFDLLQPLPLWTIARDCDSHNDFRSFGGLLDPHTYESPIDDDSGIMWLSTNGFAQAGSQGNLVIELRKQNMMS